MCIVEVLNIFIASKYNHRIAYFILLCKIFQTWPKCNFFQYCPKKTTSLLEYHKIEQKTIDCHSHRSSTLDKRVCFWFLSPTTGNLAARINTIPWNKRTRHMKTTPFFSTGSVQLGLTSTVQPNIYLPSTMQILVNHVHQGLMHMRVKLLFRCKIESNGYILISLSLVGVYCHKWYFAHPILGRNMLLSCSSTQLRMYNRTRDHIWKNI